MRQDRLSLVLPTYKREGLRILSISHMEDLDGIAAQALLIRALHEVITVLVDYSYPSHFANILKDVDIAVITDLGISEHNLNQIVNSISPETKIFWVDHHIHPSRSAFPPNVIFFHDQNAPSTCAILGREGFVRDRWEATLGHMATLNDKGKTHPLGDALSFAIEESLDNMPRLLQLSNALSSGIIPGWIWSAAQSMRQKINKLKSSLKNSYMLLLLGDIEVMIGTEKGMTPTRICKVLSEIKMADIYIGIKVGDPSSVAIFSKSFDVEQIARHFGGGGHRSFAGFIAHTHEGSEISDEFLDRLSKILRKTIGISN